MTWDEYMADVEYLSEIGHDGWSVAQTWEWTDAFVVYDELASIDISDLPIVWPGPQ